MNTPLFALAALLLPAFAGAQTIVVKPYVQPGNGSGLEGGDVKVIAWLTDQTPGEFAVEFAVASGEIKTVMPVRVALDLPRVSGGAPKAPPPPTAPGGIPVTLEEVKKDMMKVASAPVLPKEQRYFKYAATLTALPLDSEVAYRVKLGQGVVREAKFRTRASATKPIKFVMVGDMADGKAAQNAIAFQVSKAAPDFLVALGDIVYSGGRVSEYLHHFWPTYNNATVASPQTGAPLMQSIPFYPVIGNHDADMAKLPETPDALGAFYFFHGPLNGPGVGPWNTPLGKDEKVASAFRAAAGTSYPALCEYSFDYGPAHFLVLDTNSYNTASFMQLAPWVEKDLRESKQPWKFVCMHAPLFHTSPQHYSEQKMRLLEPIFEANGVDVVFAGHVHNYQRSKPLRFTPKPAVRDARGRVNGDFVFDDEFDGVTKTTPKGVIHIVTGGGGAALYNAKEFDKTVAQLAKENPGNYVPLTAKYVADKHSFSFVELSPEEFVLTQISLDGQEVDRWRITKGAAAK